MHNSVILCIGALTGDSTKGTIIPDYPVISSEFWKYMPGFEAYVSKYWRSKSSIGGFSPYIFVLSVISCSKYTMNHMSTVVRDRSVFSHAWYVITGYCSKAFMESIPVMVMRTIALRDSRGFDLTFPPERAGYSSDGSFNDTEHPKLCAEKFYCCTTDMPGAYENPTVMVLHITLMRASGKSLLLK